MKSKKETLALIDLTFNRMARICESTREWDQYVRMCEQEEKDHRKHAPAWTSFGITKAKTAQLFAIRNVFMALAKIGYQAETKDYFAIKQTIFAAVAIADIKKDELNKEFKYDEMLNFVNNVDYVELIKVN